MPLKLKNAVDILSESYGTDIFYKDPLISNFNDQSAEVIADDLGDIVELDKSLKVTAEMVTIIQDEKQNRFFVEHTNLLSYMESNDIEDIEVALKNVCEGNNVPYENTILLIESKEDIIDSVNEAKSKISGKSKEKLSKKLQGTAKFFKDVKDKGIKIMSKKSKGKCKSK